MFAATAVALTFPPLSVDQPKWPKGYRPQMDYGNNTVPNAQYWGPNLLNNAACTTCVGKASVWCPQSNGGVCHASQQSCSAACKAACVAMSSGCVSSLNTNKWWNDLVFDQTLGVNTLPAVTHPYFLRAPKNGLFFDLPGLEVTGYSFISLFQESVGFSIYSEASIINRQVTAFDDLSVTLEWYTSPQNTDAVMRATLVRGDPYVTMHYPSVTHKAVIHSIFPITSINGNAHVQSGSPMTASSFEILCPTVDGPALYLLTAGGEEVTITWSHGADTLQPPSQTRRIIVTSKPGGSSFTGVLRLARIYNGNQMPTFLKFSSCIIESTNVNIDATNVDNVIVNYQYQTVGGCTPMLVCLPHHQWTITNPGQLIPGITMTSVRGTMMGVYGSFSINVPIDDVGFNAPWANKAFGDNSDYKEMLRTSLKSDATWAHPWNPCIYTLGKQLAKEMRLALIAEELSEPSIIAEQTTKVAGEFHQFFATDSYMLRYDPVWGGICSKDGLQAPENDYGQGWYNDHHFHYGYFIYAAAVMAKYNTTWKNIHNDDVITLIRDIANPSKDDPYFPTFRLFDWFECHSYASGLFAFGDVKNQESTSEAVNAWYGIKLYGEATGNTQIEQLGRGLLALEIYGAHSYWHIDLVKRPNIYPPAFRDHGIAGIVWCSKVDHATFFGLNEEYIQGIQMLPFTPITEALLSPCWVAQDMKYLDRIVGLVDRPSSWGPLTDPWKGFLLLAQSIIYRGGMIGALQGLTTFDDGNTMTNSLYFAMTRPPPPACANVPDSKKVKNMLFVVMLSLICVVSCLTAAVVSARRYRMWKRYHCLEAVEGESVGVQGGLQADRQPPVREVERQREAEASQSDRRQRSAAQTQSWWSRMFGGSPSQEPNDDSPIRGDIRR
jgi:endo-1,3(4)-beta-glucanase